MLLHNALRVDKLFSADITDLGVDRGHQVLTVLGKGDRRAKIALTPGTLGALHVTWTTAPPEPALDAGVPLRDVQDYAPAP